MIAVDDRRRRFLEVTAAIALWMAISLTLHLSLSEHLLVGIPLTVAFQLGVRRQPLRALWIRDGGIARVDATTLAIAAVVALYPAYQLVTYIRHDAPWDRITLALARVAGAIALAYALRNVKRPLLRPLAQCLAIVGGLATIMTITAAFGLGLLEQRSLVDRMTIGLTTMLRYLPIWFVVEEISFRGAFDAHLHHPGEARGIWTALYISSLWGVWHLPGNTWHLPIGTTIAALVVMHCVLGVPLSLYWRRSGNLLVPASAHAFADAVRTALIGVG